MELLYKGFVWKTDVRKMFLQSAEGSFFFFLRCSESFLNETCQKIITDLLLLLRLLH